MFEIFVYDTYEEVSQKAFEVMKKLVSEKPNAVLGLATGSSPVGLYKKMVEDHKNNGTSYADIVSYNLDEYIGLPVTHSQSYSTFMHENLFDLIDIKKGNVHLPSGVSSNLEKHAADYETELELHPQDIQVLGVGSNGHIGFNEPGSSFDSVTHVVTLKHQTRLDNARFFATLEEVPTHAVTMGIQDIMRAKTILMVATSLKKADAVYGMIKGDISENVPASILQKHPHVIVVLDKAAASKL